MSAYSPRKINLKKTSPPSNFVHGSIDLSALSPIFSCNLVGSSLIYIPSHHNLLILCWKSVKHFVFKRGCCKTLNLSSFFFFDIHVPPQPKSRRVNLSWIPGPGGTQEGLRPAPSRPCPKHTNETNQGSRGGLFLTQFFSGGFSFIAIFYGKPLYNIEINLCVCKKNWSHIISPALQANQGSQHITSHTLT